MLHYRNARGRHGITSRRALHERADSRGAISAEQKAPSVIAPPYKARRPQRVPPSTKPTRLRRRWEREKWRLRGSFSITARLDCASLLLTTSHCLHVVCLHQHPFLDPLFIPRLYPLVVFSAALRLLVLLWQQHFGRIYCWQPRFAAFSCSALACVVCSLALFMLPRLL